MVDVGATSVSVGRGVGGTGVAVGDAGGGVGDIGLGVGDTGVNVGDIAAVAGGVVGVMMGLGPEVGVSCLGAIIYLSPTMTAIATTANMPKPTIHFKTPGGAAMPVG